MEIAPPTIAEGIARCADAGAETVIVFPYFLGPGLHTSETIPELVAAAAPQHPNLKIRVSNPFGLHEGLIDVVLERIAEIT